MPAPQGTPAWRARSPSQPACWTAPCAAGWPPTCAARIGRGELALHYQPRIRLVDGRRTGAEALLRWHHPARGSVPPAAFIPIAEGSDLIVALGGWALRRAAADAARHPGLGRVSVNVSARQLAAGVLPAQVDLALAESGLAPERLELELTESLPLAEAGAGRRHARGAARPRHRPGARRFRHRLCLASPGCGGCPSPP